MCVNLSKRKAGSAILILWMILLYFNFSIAARIYKYRSVVSEIPDWWWVDDVGAAAALGLLLCLVARTVVRFEKGPGWFFSISIILFVLWLGFTLIGISITGSLSIPVTVKLIYNIPDLIFVRTAMADQAVASSLVKQGVYLLFAVFVIVTSSAIIFRISKSIQSCGVICALLAGGFLVVAVGFVDTDRQHRGSNPIMSIIRSMAVLALEGGIKERYMSTLTNFDRDISVIADELIRSPLPQYLQFNGERYNILIYVFETGISTVMGLGVDHNAITPNLNEIANRSIYLRRHFSPWINSTKSIFSIITSRYPDPGFRTSIHRAPDLKTDSFVSVLHSSGYVGRAYVSIMADYDRMDEFLMHQGIDYIYDRDSLKLSRIHGVFGDDGEMVEKYLDSYTSEPGKKRLDVFFPSNSHWPGFFPEKSRVVGLNDPLSRYKNAIHYQDKTIGRIYAGLEERGMLDKTIVVIVPDHGASFGLGIDPTDSPVDVASYHVPVLIDHPLLRKDGKGIIYDAVSSHVDIGPTLLAMVSERRLRADAQGRDLTSDFSARLVFFYQDFGVSRVFATNGYRIDRLLPDQQIYDHWEWDGALGVKTAESYIDRERWEEKVKAFVIYQEQLLEGYVNGAKGLL